MQSKGLPQAYISDKSQSSPHFAERTAFRDRALFARHGLQHPVPVISVIYRIKSL